MHYRYSVLILLELQHLVLSATVGQLERCFAKSVNRPFARAHSRRTDGRSSLGVRGNSACELENVHVGGKEILQEVDLLPRRTAQAGVGLCDLALW